MATIRHCEVCGWEAVWFDGLCAVCHPPEERERWYRRSPWWRRIVCRLAGHIRWAPELGGDCVRCGR